MDVGLPYQSERTFALQEIAVVFYFMIAEDRSLIIAINVAISSHNF